VSVDVGAVNSDSAEPRLLTHYYASSTVETDPEYVSSAEYQILLPQGDGSEEEFNFNIRKLKLCCAFWATFLLVVVQR